MNERIYEKPKLHYLSGRYNYAAGACNSGTAFLCAFGGGFGSSSDVNCQNGEYANTACTTGYRPAGRVCTSGTAVDAGLCTTGTGGNPSNNCNAGSYANKKCTTGIGFGT